MSDYDGWLTSLRDPNRHRARWSAIQVLYVLNAKAEEDALVDRDLDELLRSAVDPVLAELTEEFLEIGNLGPDEQVADPEVALIVDTYGEMLLAQAYILNPILPDADPEAFEATLALLREATELPRSRPRAIAMVALGAMLSAQTSVESDPTVRGDLTLQATRLWSAAVDAGHPRSADWALANLSLASQDLEVEELVQKYRGMLVSEMVDQDALTWLDSAPSDLRFRFLSQISSAFTVRRSPTNDPTQSQIAIFRGVEELGQGNAATAIARTEYALFPDIAASRPVDLTMACALMACAAETLSDPIEGYIWRTRAGIPVPDLGAASADDVEARGWHRLAEMVGACLANLGDPDAPRWLHPSDAASAPEPLEAGVAPAGAAPPYPKFCSQCGSPLTAGVKFCSECGFRVAP